MNPITAQNGVERLAGANGTAVKPVHVFVQLRAMHNVPENWDGYGGAATDPKAIEAAVDFLHQLAQFEIGCAILPGTIASPTRVGGVLLEWERGPDSLEVEIDLTETITGAYLNLETNESRDFAVDSRLEYAGDFFELASRISRI